MAKQKIDFVSVDPNSGIGSSNVVIGVEAHKGRRPKELVLEVYSTKVGSYPALEVVESGAPETVSIESTATITKDGGTLTITGKTNSPALTFKYVPSQENPLSLTLPASYLVNGSTVLNGVNIPNDPGADDEIPFSISFTGIAANKEALQLTGVLEVTTDNGVKESCTIIQLPSEITTTLDFIPASVELNSENGYKAEVIVVSNQYGHFGVDEVVGDNYVVEWGDGSGQTVMLSPGKWFDSATKVTVSSVANEYRDREIQIVGIAGSGSQVVQKTLTVTQVGKREELYDNTGTPLLDSEGKKLLALK